MRILINHLTRMKFPYICVAGIDRKGSHTRPVLASGQIHRDLLVSNGGPFALGAGIELAIVRPRRLAPEVEDVVFDPSSTDVFGHIGDDGFLERLDRSVRPSLRAIFGPTLERLSGTAAALPQHTGSGSLGVLRLDTARLTVESKYDKTEVRLHFTDAELGNLAIKVNDLRLWEKNQVDASMSDIELIEDALDGCLVAVGLTRAHEVPRYPGARHWLQVNNVYPADRPLWERE